MDADLIHAKEDSIVRCVRRIESKSALTLEELMQDYDAQDVVVFNLERAVQQAVDIATHLLADSPAPVPDTMRDAFMSLHRIGGVSEETASRMVKAVGFRNTAVHAYQQIDWAIVHSIITDRLVDFAAFIRDVDRYMESRADN